MPVPVALQPRQTSLDWLGQFLETVKPTMKKISNSSRRLSDHISRALNKIRKPSTAGEITELVNVSWTLRTALSKQKTSRSGCDTPRARP